MALNVQRSIPFPRVSLNKLLAYIEAVGDNYGLRKGDVRNKNLDIGKGKGDITRFFLRIGIVEENGEAIELTQHGWAIYNSIKMGAGAKQLHSYLMNALPQYKLLIDVLLKNGSINEDELFNLLNEEIRRLSPSSWINKVAFKALLGLLIDAHIVVKVGKVINYTNGDMVTRIKTCIDTNKVKLGDYYLLSINKLSKCIGMQINVNDIKVGTISNAPGDSMIKIANIDEFIKSLIMILEKKQ